MQVKCLYKRRFGLCSKPSCVNLINYLEEYVMDFWHYRLLVHQIITDPAMCEFYALQPHIYIPIYWYICIYLDTVSNSSPVAEIGGDNNSSS